MIYFAHNSNTGEFAACQSLEDAKRTEFSRSQPNLIISNDHKDAYARCAHAGSLPYWVATTPEYVLAKTHSRGDTKMNPYTATNGTSVFYSNPNGVKFEFDGEWNRVERFSEDAVEACIGDNLPEIPDAVFNAK